MSMPLLAWFTVMPSALQSLADFIGAHRAPDREAHERDRARQRAAISLAFCLGALWAALPTGPGAAVAGLPLAVAGLSLAYALLALVHLRWVLPRSGVTLGSQYGFIVLDSVCTVTALVGAPSVLAALYPVLMVQIVRCGMRYGLRALWLSWAAAALTAAALMPLSPFWSSDTGLLHSFVVMLVVIPVLFGPLVQTLVRANDSLRAAATVDALTGLGNRRLLFDQLRQARARSARANSMLAVMLFDLDRFKVVNDTLGHAAGDRLLAAVADCLRAHVRDGELAARLGGDEFVLLTEGLPLNHGLALAHDRAVQLVAQIQLAADAVAPVFGVTASAGVHCWTAHAQATTLPERDIDSDLLAHADRAMYASKRAGPGRVAGSALQPASATLAATAPAPDERCRPPPSAPGRAQG
jgi:diguanylate cyclase (GGDEF)-like protein